MNETHLEGFRLSPQQKHLWLLQADQHFAVQCMVLLQGSLQYKALQDVIAQIMQSYEIVRTTFPLVPGMSMPLQVLSEKNAFLWREIDLSEESEQKRNACIDEAVSQFRQRQVDLAVGPVLATHLLKLDDQRHLLLLKLPALCADAETLRILVAEVSRAYSSWFVKEEAADAIQMQYADIAEWQNELLESEETASGRKFWQAYWKKHALSTLSAQQLPLERRLPPDATSNEQHVETSLAPEVMRAVDALALAWEVPASTLYFACWQVLLSRLSAGRQAVISVAFDGRKYEELEGAPGPLTRYIPLPDSYAEHHSMREIIQQANEMVGTVQEWQEYFNQDVLQTASVSFGFDFIDLSATYAAAEITFRVVSLEMHAEAFKLRLSCIRLADSIRTALHYDARRYTAEYIQLIAARFQAVVSEMVAHPESTAGGLELVTGKERTQLLVDWNATTGTYPHDACLHHLFEAQVQRTPDAIALAFKEECLTYADVNQRANQLAHYLQKHGVGPEARVGLWVDRSLDALIGELGILKAGGAYVPLEPTYPLERLAFMVQDSHLSLLVTQQQYKEAQRALPLENIHVMYLDLDRSLLDQQSACNPTSSVAPAHLAYVIYTSGSTGKPKGVLIEHRSPLNLLNALEQAVYFPFLRAHPQLADWPLRISLNAPLAFDASVQQLVMLLRGHSLYLIPQEIRTDGDALLTYLRHHEIQVFDCTCSQLKILLAAGLLDEAQQNTPEAFPQLFLIAGEAIDAHVWEQLLGAPHLWFYNIYGPTECTVDATAMRIAWDSPQFNEPLIGQPLANYQVYVLDNQLRPVPVGVAGEIYIGGVGLARGYHMRADVTAERFIPHPFSSEPGRRLYKTGDLAYFHTNGKLQFVGRTDDQIKLRGYRIEPGEIESVLLQHSAVQEIAVIVREDRPGEPYLVAYFTLTPQEQEASEQVAQKAPINVTLRNWAQERLPAYMVPTFFVQLEHMPSSVNGKVDRRALPLPEPGRPALNQAFVAPRTATEKALADAWAEVLGLDKVGIDDNFFELGGDSIRSIRIQALAREQHIPITLQELFRNQTIRKLTQAIEDKLYNTVAEGGSQPFSLITEQDRALLPQGVVDAYPLAMLQAGMIFRSELDPDTSMFQDMVSMHLRAPLHIEMFQQALQALVARHPILRTAFDLEHYSQPLQLVYDTTHVPLEIADLRHYTQTEQEQKLAAFREAEKMRHFDWSRPPLIRFAIHLRSAETIQITLTEHHCILDGWSVASLFTELFSHYWHLIEHVKGSVAEPPGAFFRDFVALELQARKSVEAQTFWEKTVDQAPFTAIPRWPSSLQLPKKYYPKPRKLTFSQDTTARLTRLAQMAAVPLKSVLLTAHLYILRTLSGSADVLTGVVSNGRPEMLDGDRVLGLFLNTLPFRLHLTGTTWLDLIKLVFQAELDMIPFRHYPVAQLEIRQGRGSLFETAFNFTHFHVYQGIQDIPGSEPLDLVRSEQTNLALLTQFVMAPYTAQLTMDLLGYELSDEQIEVFEDYYQRTLEAMISDPQAPYCYYSLLSSCEREKVLQEWNATQAVYPEDMCIHTLFAAQTKRTPGAIAVTSGHTQLTYLQVELRANQVAHYLRSLGVGPEKCVGICLERSAEMIIAVLGVLKAGGAYIPLDAAYPPERLAFMLQDASVDILLTQESLVDKLPLRKAQIVYLADSQREYYAQDEAPDVDVRPANLAYVIYTSGSTGMPKGVMITHASLVNAYHAWETVYVLRAQPGVHLQMASFSFDVFSGDVVRALCSGGTLVICPHETLLDAEQLYSLMCEKKVNHAEFVPQVLTHLTDYLLASKQRLDFMRILIAGSDTWHLQEYLTLRQLCGAQTRIFNTYGLTEVTIDSTYFTCAQIEPGIPGMMPIGRPFANTQCYILDRHLQPVPTGVPGELFIGGAGLGRGYLGQPELTAERSIPNAFGGYTGERIYKTGDRARYLPDGTIELLGRNDQQIKLRGFRIEPGEIEAVLLRHPAVQEAVVQLYESRPGNAYLVAYVTLTAEGMQPDVNEQPEDTASTMLRQWMQGWLPTHMVPSAVVQMTKMPLTPNGKVDRQALPAPENVPLQTTLLEPRTPLEELLVEIWAEVLGRETISVNENFFEIGGHSLLATQLISRLRSALQMDLPLRVIFEQPTIERFALIIEEALLEEIENLDEEEAQQLASQDLSLLEHR